MADMMHQIAREQSSAYIRRLELALSTLRDFFLYNATCPCCEETDKCMDECTFAEDCPSDAEIMEDVRAVLRTTDVMALDTRGAT